jgi:carbon monoxide dehydrogenase subunit G
MVEAPLDKVQDAVWSVERSSQMIENIKKSELQQQNGNQKTMLMQLKAGSLPVQQVVMVFTLYPDKHEITFKTTQSQAADLEGAYILEAAGNRTRLTYEAKSTDKIAVPFPAGVLETANREVFVNTVRGINKFLGAAPAPTAG